MSKSEKGELKCKEFYVCERDEKSWNIEPNETNIGLETLNQIKQRVPIFKFFLKFEMA